MSLAQVLGHSHPNYRLPPTNNQLHSRQFDYHYNYCLTRRQQQRLLPNQHPLTNLSTHTTSDTEEAIVEVAGGTYRPNPVVIEGISEYSVTVRATGDVTLIFDPDSPKRQATTCFQIRDIAYDATPPLETIPDDQHSITIEGFEFDLRGELVNAIDVADSAKFVVVRDNTFRKADGAANIASVNVDNGGHALAIEDNTFDGVALSFTSNAEPKLVRHITNNSFTGFTSNSPPDLLLAGATIREFAHNTIDSARIALNVWASGIDSVHHNTFTNSSVGVRITNGTVWSFHHNEVRNCDSGLEIYSGGAIETLRDSTIAGVSDIGLRLGPVGLIKTLKMTTIQENQTGIELRGGNDYHSRIEMFTDNRIRDNKGTGLELGEATRVETLTRSHFTGNDTHLLFIGSGDDVSTPTRLDKMTLEQNIFADDSSWGVMMAPGYDRTGTLTAIDNYWGDSTGPSGGVVDPETIATADGSGTQLYVPVGTRPIRFDPHLQEKPIETGPRAVIGNTAPSDPDNDGKYEDINGNGELDVTDIQALYANKDATVVQSNTEAFDFNNDGNVDILDVQALFYEHTDG